MKHKFLPIGSVSHDTLRNEDLLPAMIDAARSVKMQRVHHEMVREIEYNVRTNYSKALDEKRILTEDSIGELMSDDVERLTDMLNSYVPDFCYFGTNEGDGADFGVWPIRDVDGDFVAVGKCRPLASTIPQDHFMEVNDHGNCTMYRKVKAGRGYRWVEQWSVV